jgi:hypothetical protein
VVAVCDGNSLEGNTLIKDALFAVYSLYTTALQNPFQELCSQYNNSQTSYEGASPLGNVQAAPVTSRQFHLQVKLLVQRFNSQTAPNTASIKK